MNIKINDSSKDIYINILNANNDINNNNVKAVRQKKSSRRNKKNIVKNTNKAKVDNKDGFAINIKNKTKKTTLPVDNKQDEMKNFNNRNIYILNTIIGIDEDDIITGDTLEKVQIDQNSLVQLMEMSNVGKKTAEVIGRPMTEKIKEPSYKDNYIASAVYKDSDIDDYKLKYGEVAFVDSYIGD